MNGREVFRFATRVMVTSAASSRRGAARRSTTSTSTCRTRRTSGSSTMPPSTWACRRRRSRRTSTGTATRRPPRSRSASPRRVEDGPAQAGDGRAHERASAAGLTWGSAYMTWSNGDGVVKVAFCFPGPGLAGRRDGPRDGRRPSPRRARSTSEAIEAVGFDVARLCFEGPIEELTRTEIQQPALVATSLACLRAVETRGDLAPTSSSATRSASTRRSRACGALSDREAVALVRERGEATAGGRDEHPGAMAAIIGLEDAVVEELCAGDRERVARELQLPRPARRLGRDRRGGPAARGGGGARGAQDREASDQRRLPQPARRARRRAAAARARSRLVAGARHRPSCRP